MFVFYAAVTLFFHRDQSSPCFCLCAGPETVQERGADGEHRLAVDRRPRQRRQGRSGQDRPHQPGVHGGGREDRPEPPRGETLAVRGAHARFYIQFIRLSCRSDVLFGLHVDTVGSASFSSWQSDWMGADQERRDHNAHRGRRLSGDRKGCHGSDAPVSRTSQPSHLVGFFCLFFRHAGRRSFKTPPRSALLWWADEEQRGGGRVRLW